MVDEEGSDIIEPFFGHFLLDSIRSMYLVVLGEFELDSYSEHPYKALLQIFFLLATFMSFIVMLSMLIAIMGNTFDFIVSRKNQYSLQNKLSIMCSYHYVIARKNPQQDFNNYLFVVTPHLYDEDIEDRE